MAKISATIEAACILLFNEARSRIDRLTQITHRKGTR